jgi:hypothetical protein
MSKTASLTSGLVAKKGQAAPAVIAAASLKAAPVEPHETKSAASVLQGADSQA